MPGGLSRVVKPWALRARTRTSPQIQIDAFEVQLGAGILLQFHLGNQKVVRVLADAGVSASGYPADHVLKKLQGCFEAMEEGAGRYLDLIVGTHYDKDHLAGLVPIIDDTSITIGEAWMPPVANDTSKARAGSEPREKDFLAVQFAGQDGEHILRNYLEAKAQDCEEVLAIERAARAHKTGDGRFWRSRFRTELVEMSVPNAESASIGDYRSYFERHFDNASEIAGLSLEHADEPVEVPPHHSAISDELQKSFFYHFRFPYRGDIKTTLEALWDESPQSAGEHALRFAEIRRSAASDAINATSLNEVVAALRRRGIPIRCEIIQDGQPRRFIWDEQKRRFIASQRRDGSGPEIQLLAPSQSLVEKHRERLPIGDYMGFLTLKRLPVKSITPSNQLSYVFRIDYANQQLLIAGDAGCVDFKPEGSNDFFEKLLQKMSRLQFIQIAHHGGLNAHFYNVLLESGFPDQTEESFMLLSHATHDRTRPSDIFRRFIELARKSGDDFKLLFTSEPTASRVADFDELIHPVVGGVADDRGDVRLVFDGAGWIVTKHLIKVQAA